MVQGVPEYSGIGCTRIQWYRVYQSTGAQGVPPEYRVYQSTVVQSVPWHSSSGCTGKQWYRETAEYNGSGFSGVQGAPE